MSEENGHRHTLSRPLRYDSRRGKYVTMPHRTGVLVTCTCGWGGILIEDSDYARLLARAIAGSQKGG